MFLVVNVDSPFRMVEKGIPALFGWGPVRWYPLVTEKPVSHFLYLRNYILNTRLVWEFQQMKISSADKAEKILDFSFALQIRTFHRYFIWDLIVCV